MRVGARCAAVMLSLCIPATACQFRTPRQVVLVTIDTLRADHLGLRRDGILLTPALDRLAADAVRYRDVLANASTTVTSHVSMLSGLYPWRHRVISNRHVLSADIPWLPETLHARGFATGAVVSSATLKGSESGLDRGFDVYDDRFDSTEVNRSNQLVKTPGETTKVALAWLTANRGRDFFLWVHYLPPHGPYTPPEEFVRDMPRSESATRLPVSSENYTEGMIPRYQRLRDEEDPEAYRRAYAGHVRYVDRHVGRLLDGLRELRLYDEALVIVTSDHGESLGEHGWYFCHGNLVYQDQVAIPLLVKLPANGNAGRVVAAPVEGVDIAPTVLHVLGLDDAMRVDGRAILADLLGVDSRPRFTQSDDAEVLGAIAGATKLVLRVTNKGPAGASHPARAVFDLASDPAEAAPLTGEPAAPIAQLEEALRQSYRGISRATPPLTPEQEERLRALGYTR